MKSGNYQHLAMNNFNNLKGFASKMRDQARDAAKKLPSLDEMAAQDDYIHKEEFNVKGEKAAKVEPKVENGEHNSLDTPSPWSLIDKRIFQKEEEESAATSLPVPSGIPLAGDETFMNSSLSPDEGSTLPPNDALIDDAPIRPRSLMMSVVTDAMTAKPATPEKEEKEEEEDGNSILSDSSSDSDGDEEDPILSMIRQDKGEDDKSKKRGQKTKRKKKEKDEQPKMHRFLADMADAENQLETNSKASEEQAPNLSMPLSSPKELGSWMKNMASNQMNKIWKLPDSAPVTTTSSAPPLASTWKSKPAAPNPLQEEYHSQDSSDLLGDEELEQLAMMKQSNSGGKLSAMMGVFYEYRQFAFILFTLILAVVVYFFKFSALEDGVS